MSLLEDVEKGGAVDGGDHEDAVAFGDHVLDLGYLSGNVVLGVLEVDLVAASLEDLLHVSAVGDPAGRGLGGHRDSDCLLGEEARPHYKGSRGSEENGLGETIHA